MILLHTHSLLLLLRTHFGCCSDLYKVTRSVLKRGVGGEKKRKMCVCGSTMSFEDKNFSSIKKLGLPAEWDEIITDMWRKDAQLVRHTGHINYLQSKKWAFLNFPETDVFKMVVFILEEMIVWPAIMISQLMYDYIEEQTGDILLPRKEERALRMRISRVMKKLVRAGLVKKVHIPAEEIGRLAASIYVAPFALDEEFEKCKRDYLAIGGGRGPIKKPVDEDAWANKMAQRKKLVEDKLKIIEETLETEVAYCEKCNTEYTVKFAGERCMNCDDNFSRVSILKTRKKASS